jgi:hypothetical protein
MTGGTPMNSTNNENSIQVKKFFFEELVPLAKKLHHKNDPVFFHKKPDSAKDTYFIRRKIITMASKDFEAGGCSSPEDLKEALISLWVAEGHDELQTIAEAIIKLAGSAHYPEEQSSEVSPFIYVMF